MERLTERNEQGTAYFYPKCFEICGGLGCDEEKMHDCPIETAICDKLGKYEDAEETFEKAYGQCYIIPKNSIWEVNGIDINDAIEKQVPKKPLNIRFHVDHKSGECSICGTRLAHFGDMNYCHNCGNKMDWEDEEDAKQ